MNDFLKKIRSVQKPTRQRQSGITRKTYDARNPPPNERRKIMDRRTVAMEQMEKKSEMFSEFLRDSIPIIRDNISRITSSIEKIADIKETVSKEKIREHREIGNFFENLNIILEKQVIPSMNIKTSMDQKPETAKKQNENFGKFKSFGLDGNHTKEDVLEIIRTMRQNGATFAAIADYLKDNGIPTFSGRGKWHAQTIHRLYK